MTAVAVEPSATLESTVTPEPDRADEPDRAGEPDRGRSRVQAREEARVLFRRLAELPDCPERDRTRARLVEEHLPLVRYFARRYAGRGEPMDDLFQAGSLGLVKAVDRFDPARGLEFSTYAAPTILGEIRRHFRDRTWSVHVHRRLQETSAEVTRLVGVLTQELNRAPSVAELAERSGHTDEEVLEALDCAAAYTADSLDARAAEDRTLADKLGGDDPALGDVELHESLGPALATLPEREQRILQLRFFGNQTQSQIAAALGISQMHVSRLLARTLGQLREQLLA